MNEISTNENQTSSSCSTCAHSNCMFHGEHRAPIYRSGVIRTNGYTAKDGSCWIDPKSKFGKSILKDTVVK